MANNERVSQLIELFAADLRSEDLFLVTDMSQRESKKLEMGQLLLFIENSGSFNAFNANFAATASYVAAGNIDGMVAVANISSQSLSASWAAVAWSSSYAQSASWSPAIPSVSSSYSDRSGHADTASYSNVSSLATTAATAFNLYYPNTSTSSFAISASNAVSVSWAQNTPSSISASWASHSLSSVSASWASASISSSFTQTASYLIGAYTNPIKAWACVTWSSGKTTPQVFQNSNINTFTFLNFFTSAGNATYYILPTTWSQYGVTFTNATSNADYIVMGGGMAPYQYPEIAQVLCHPIHGRRTTTGFTMSVVTQGVNDWFTITSGSYPLDEYPFINFQVIG